MDDTITTIYCFLCDEFLKAWGHCHDPQQARLSAAELMTPFPWWWPPPSSAGTWSTGSPVPAQERPGALYATSFLGGRLRLGRSLSIRSSVRANPGSATLT